MNGTVFIAIALTAASSAAGVADPPQPTVQWQASAQNVAARVGELAEVGRAYGDDDAKLADAVGEVKDRVAAKDAAPVWSKKTSWIDGTGDDRVLFGVGVFHGTKGNRHLAFIVAENRAKVEIAKLQNVTIVRKSEANGWRTVTTTTTATLANVVIVDWYADGDTVFALAACGKPVTVEPTAPWIP